MIRVSLSSHIFVPFCPSNSSHCGLSTTLPPYLLSLRHRSFGVLLFVHPICPILSSFSTMTTLSPINPSSTLPTNIILSSAFPHHKKPQANTSPPSTRLHREENRTHNEPRHKREDHRWSERFLREADWVRPHQFYALAPVMQPTT